VVCIAQVGRRGDDNLTSLYSLYSLQMQSDFRCLFYNLAPVPIRCGFVGCAASQGLREPTLPLCNPQISHKHVY